MRRLTFPNSLRSQPEWALLLTTSPNLVHSILYIPGLSDHCFVHFNATSSLGRRANNCKTIRDYSRGDYDSINTALDSYFERSVGKNWNLFRKKVDSLITTYIPTYVIKERQRAPWFSTDLKRLRNKKKRLFRQAKQTNSSARHVYQAALFDYRTSIKEAKRVFLNNTLPSLLATNPSKFWKTVKPIEKKAFHLQIQTGSRFAMETVAVFPAQQKYFRKNGHK